MNDTLSPVKFDAAPEQNPALWLDLRISMDGRRPVVRPAFKDMATAPSGACENNTPVSIMKGMISRLCQTDAKGTCVMQDVLKGVTSLVQCGWNKQSLRNLFFNCCPRELHQTARSKGCPTICYKTHCQPCISLNVLDWILQSLARPQLPSGNRIIKMPYPVDGRFLLCLDAVDKTRT